MKTFNDIRLINVADKVEKKDGLTYLSWAWAWDVFKQNYPDANYTIIKNSNGLPYFESEHGAMVYTTVTAGGITHEMWLPVMDGKNKAMKSQPYTYQVWDSYKRQKVDKSVEAYTMFDINKTVMRCLVKNLAMFGLGLYIYAGEDLPDPEPESDKHKENGWSMKQFNDQLTPEEIGTPNADGIYRIPSGTHKGRTVKAVYDLIGHHKLEDTVLKFEERIKEGKPYSGFTMEQMHKFVDEATALINEVDQAGSDWSKFNG